MLEAADRGSTLDRIDACQIVRGHDRIFVLLRNYNRAQARVSDWAANEPNFSHRGHLEVTDILAASAEEALVFLSRNRCTDARLHSDSRQDQAVPIIELAIHRPVPAFRATGRPRPPLDLSLF